MQAKTKRFEQVSGAFRACQQQRSLSAFCRTEREKFVHIPDWPTLLRPLAALSSAVYQFFRSWPSLPNSCDNYARITSVATDQARHVLKLVLCSHKRLRG